MRSNRPTEEVFRVKPLGHQDFEEELRRYRPEPRGEFLATLEQDLHEQRSMRQPLTLRRAALATGLSAGMLALFASFGGIGYASSAVHSTFHVSKVVRLVGISHHSQSKAPPARLNAQASGGAGTPSQDQYRPGKGCGDKNHVHLRVNECK
jgi:hypothetical protein